MCHIYLPSFSINGYVLKLNKSCKYNYFYISVVTKAMYLLIEYFLLNYFISYSLCNSLFLFVLVLSCLLSALKSLVFRHVILEIDVHSLSKWFLGMNGYGHLKNCNFNFVNYY